MASRTAEKEGWTIVMLGQFNPAIFQPAWFAREKLIGEQDAENAEIEIIHPDLVSFDLGWAKINVDRDKLVMGSNEEPAERLRDLVIGTFQLLRHTPISRLGINHDAHFRLQSESELLNIAKTLTPASPWGSIMDRPAFEVLTVAEKKPVIDDSFTGFFRVRVEPSRPFGPGVYVNVNDEFMVVSEDRVLQGASQMVSCLENYWDDSRVRAQAAFDCVLSLRRQK